MSLYDYETSALSLDNIPSYVDYSEDGCPDTLAFSYKYGICAVECIYPLFKDYEQILFDVSGYTLGILSFLLCYFYCFTALLRPIMLRYPNSHIFHMMFSGMIMSSSVLVSLILGKRYVFCDTNVDQGHENWACRLSGLYIISIITNIFINIWEYRSSFYIWTMFFNSMDYYISYYSFSKNLFN